MQPPNRSSSPTTRAQPSTYAEMYKRDNLPGGHVIMLGKGNEAAAMESLKAYPGGLQGGHVVCRQVGRYASRPRPLPLPPL